MTSTCPLPLLEASIHLGSQAFVQVSNLKGTLVVNPNEISQPMREALTAPLTEARHDVLYEAVSIFLLVRQQLQRINQIPAEALRYCMRIEDFGLVDTSTCLYDLKQPVWLLPVVLFSTNRAPPIIMLSSRDPPNVVFQRISVAMQAQV